MVKPVEKQASKKLCCHTAVQKKACTKNKVKNNNDDCTKPSCTMMLSCSMCGFLPVAALILRPALPQYLAKPISLHKIGSLSGYQPTNWKPPKAC